MPELHCWRVTKATERRRAFTRANDRCGVRWGGVGCYEPQYLPTMWLLQDFHTKEGGGRVAEAIALLLPIQSIWLCVTTCIERRPRWEFPSLYWIVGLAADTACQRFCGLRHECHYMAGRIESSAGRANVLQTARLQCRVLCMVRLQK